jgi:hypothetical protein
MGSDGFGSVRLWRRSFFLIDFARAFPASACQNDRYVQTSEHQKRKSL